MQTLAPRPLQAALTHLRRVLDEHAASGAGDAELLQRYVAARDETAFELLVWRHGPMVLQTCRRLLHRPEDAEDAFQATFLALVRQAASIAKRQAVAAWLHRVACRVATHARALAARRARRERPEQSQIAQCPTEPPDPLVWGEVRAVLDDEVNRLPAKLRTPFILCHLEGLTNEAAARQMGCPKGTVLSRLARARDRLRLRLTRRGLGLSVAALTAGLTQDLASAAAPAALALNTVKAATLVAAGKAPAAAVSASVTALTEGVLRAMFLNKIKIAFVICFGLGILAAGTGGLVYQTPATAQSPAQVTDKTKPPAPPGEDHVRQAERVLEAARAEMAMKQTMVRIAQVELDRTVAQLQVAQKNYQKALQDAGPLQKQPPKKPAAPPAEPAAKTPTLAGGAQADLISLATAYTDALRDFEVANILNSERALKWLSEEARAIKRINFEAAERKFKLLRAIGDSALKAAEAELAHARDLYRSNLVPQSQVLAAQGKLEILRLILESGK